MEVTPTNTREIARGEQVHARHGRRVWLSGALVWVAGVLIVLALLVVLLTQRAG